MGDYRERYENLLNSAQFGHRSDHETERWRILMTALDDLTKAVTDAQAAQVAERAAITSALADVADVAAEVDALKASGVPTAAVEAAVANLQAVTPPVRPTRPRWLLPTLEPRLRLQRPRWSDA